MGQIKQCTFENLLKKKMLTYRYEVYFILFSTSCRFTHQPNTENFVYLPVPLR